MGIIGDITNLVNQAYKYWQEHNDNCTINPQELFDKYIKPSYALLKEVHNNYLELYLELKERIALEDELTEDMLNWFSKARMLRQADRSELRFIELPEVKGKNERIRNLNEAAISYLVAIRSYFFIESSSWGDSEHRRFGRLTSSSRSSETEQRLVLLLMWKQLSDQDRRAILSEKRLHIAHEKLHVFNDTNDILESLMADVIGKSPQSEEITDLVSQQTKLASSVLPQLLKTEGTDRSFDHNLEQSSRYFSWHKIMGEHIHHQLWEIERGISEVQRNFIRVRILADRS